MLRLLTPREHAQVKGIPECLIEGLPATTAHELLGQSIIYPAFVAVGELVASALKVWCLEGQPVRDESSSLVDLLRAA